MIEDSGTQATTDDQPPASATRRFSRRAVLGALGVGAAVGAVAATGVTAVAVSDRATPDEGGSEQRYDFYGEHQSGITTPMQDHLHFAALDMTSDSREQLIALLREWTAAAATMQNGLEIGGTLPYDAPPQDTGEALGLPPSGLTITFGFGQSLFRAPDGRDRFGITDQLPPDFRPLPRFPGDSPTPQFTGADLCIQACADNAQVAVHAVRNLVRIAFGRAAVSWSQLGFARSSATDPTAPTPRNLMGFKDGTNNIVATDAQALEDFVWVPAADPPPWMTGGTHLAVRKIRMTIETWDRTSLREQETVFGRTKVDGAPLSGGGEFTPPDFSLTGRAGEPLIAVDSHVALAHPDNNGGVRVLRRGYNYTDGSDGLGHLDAGLFYLAFARDLDKQFVPIQMALSRSDRMNEYVRYVGTAAFAVPPGVRAPGDYVGQPLFEA